MSVAVVVGAGPAGLMAAETMARAGLGVVVVDHMPSPGRKFLMAGRGGLNLTHSEPLDRLLDRYGSARPQLEPAIRAFPPESVRAWCEALGERTFVGSSGRVFPVAMKASPLLRAWLRRLAALGVRILPRRRWLGWTEDGALRLGNGEQLDAAATVLACGGASWPRLGSDGGWTASFQDAHVSELKPANCGFHVAWSAPFSARHAGTPLKRIAARLKKPEGSSSRGEAMVTQTGIEGSVVYALAASLREIVAREGRATLLVDLRPDLAAAVLAARLDRPRGGETLSTFLRKAAGLPPVGIGLVQEALHAGADARDLAALVKAVPISVGAPHPIARAISTAGGLAWDELGPDFQLLRRPGTFAAGEMLDWEAPTGGYLLQAAFSTGHAAGRGVLARLGRA